jgi:uncharacterized membrane protein
LESGKSIAGIGALLLVIGSFVSFLSLVGIIPAIVSFIPFSLVGIILLLIGMKDLAEYYGQKSIFQDALYAVMFGIIGIVAVWFGILSLLFGAGLVGLILALVVTFIFYILMAVHFKRAFNSLANRTGQGTFRTAGSLLLAGAILTIIIIGFILVFIAWILAIVAFFSIKAAAKPPPPPPAS